KKARTYSKGNRQKVALIAALASDVELLLLDEPPSGLDPLMEARFREVIDDEGQRGRTGLVCSPSPGPPSRPSWPARRTGCPPSPACTTCRWTGPGCAARWTAPSSTRCCGTWRRPGCAA